MSRGRKAISFRQRDVGRPPSDQPWVWRSLEMHRAPAFRKMSTACAEFIRFLEVEFMNSGGADNGRLKAPYRQLEAWGINQRRIKPAVDEAVERRLVEAAPGGYAGHARNWPTLYRLTYLSTRRRSPAGAWEWEAATDEWRGYRPAKISSNAVNSIAECGNKCSIGAAEPKLIRMTRRT